MKPYYQDSAVTIYHGDCREILPMMDPVDLVLTDLPYGNKEEYASYDDSSVNLDSLIADVFPHFQRLGKVTLLTPGVANIHRYPAPRWILSWVCPAGIGSGTWGFSCWQPILAYGPDPSLENGMGRRPDTLIRQEAGSADGHPCAKPIGVWKWVLNRGCLEGATVLDPFMGSGTTLRAAKDLGRRAIGIEIEERYCEIAARRMQQEVLPLTARPAEPSQRVLEVPSVEPEPAPE